MIEKVITSEPKQVLKVVWDGERFALIELNREKSKVILLNPREAMMLVKFLGSCGKEINA